MSVNSCAPSAGTLPYKHKIVVAGNHELSFDDNFLQQSRIIGVRFHPVQVREYLLSKNLTKMKDLLVNCTYLEDSETTVFGLRVYGSPWYSELHLCCNLLLSYLLLDLFRPRCHLWLMCLLPWRSHQLNSARQDHLENAYLCKGQVCKQFTYLLWY